MNKWKIYYSNGSTFSYEEGGPENAPPFGVLVIATYWKGERCLLHGRDWYLYHNLEGWFPFDLPGTLDHLMHEPMEWSCLKMGRTVNDETFHEALNRADKEWPLNG